jgi:drug/metabolite transporter (DMT)-like permease
VSAADGEAAAERPRAAAIVAPGPTDAALLTIGVLAVSTSGPIMAAIVAPALAVAFWRNALGALATGAYVAMRRRTEVRSLGRRHLRLTLAAGTLLALHFATWVPSLRLTSVASATALTCVQPVWSTVITHFQGRRVRPRVWVGVLVALGGALLLTGLDVSLSGKAVAGDVLALLGGMFAAGYVALGEEIRREVSTTAYTSVCYGTAATLLLVACVVGRQDLGGYSTKDWLLLGALTVGAQLLGHTLFNRVVRTTSATVVSLVILFEVPGAALLASLWLGQTPPPLAIPALALLLAGLAIVVSSRSRATPPVLSAD